MAKVNFSTNMKPGAGVNLGKKEVDVQIEGSEMVSMDQELNKIDNRNAIVEDTHDNIHQKAAQMGNTNTVLKSILEKKD